MSWHFSQALVAEFSEDTCLDGEQSVPLSSTPTPVAFYWPDKTTEHSRLSRFGMTSEPLTEDHGAALLTWFLEGFRVRTSALQAKVTASTVNEVGCGRKWLGLLARYDHDTSTWRTPQSSLVEGLDEFSETWPRWGSMRNGESWERMTVEPRTSASESGLWPTPVASDTGSRSKPYAQGGTPLSLAVKWPTPCARDYKHPGKSRLERTGGKQGEVLPQIVGGPLNPDWVEWLMGWPIGWTDLKPLETGRFQEWLQQHSQS